MDGLRGEDNIAELCRREGINPNVYYRWSKEFLEAGKKRLAGDAAREATSDEVKKLRSEAPGPRMIKQCTFRQQGFRTLRLQNHRVVICKIDDLTFRILTIEEYLVMDIP